MAELFLVLDTVTKKKKAIAVSPSGNFEQEIPTGTVDGANKDFVLSRTPTADVGVLVFLDSLVVPKANRTVNTGTKTVTFSTAPAIGQTIYVYYPY